MIKALKVVMIVFGVLMVLGGLANIIVPEQVAATYGYGQPPGHVKWVAALLGAVYVAGGVWVIAAGRDPLWNINWVKFVITWTLLSAVVTGYAIIVGYDNFSHIGGKLIFDAVFAVAFLVLYPWRSARGGE